MQQTPYLPHVKAPAASHPDQSQRWMQVWAIVIAETGGTLLAPIDDDGCECFMAFPTEADAEQALKSQKEKGFIEHGQVQRVA